MAEIAASATEAALENQQIGGLQIRVVALCTLIQMCDGYDIGAIGWSVPLLTHAWNLAPAAFALAFAFSNIGIMAGALVAGPIGDRFGRKPLLMASTAIFALASLGSAFAGSLDVLAAMRFFTGFGIAGTFAGTVALTGDYTSQRRRASMIMICFTGAPLGSFVGGQIVALLLHQGFGWQVIYVLGGLFPLVLLALAAVFLPESPRFLAMKPHLSPRQAALLMRLGIRHEPGARHVDVAAGNTVAMLFSDGYALKTILLWIIFFCSLLDMYLFGFWLPEVLHLTGYSPAEAVFASSVRDFGAFPAVLYLGLAMDRFGAPRALSLHYVAGAVFVAVVALVAMPYPVMLAAVFFAGMTIIGSQTGANATCGAIYPARMRASGIGWALGIGRVGGIVAPALGGYLLSAGVAPPRIFLCGGVFALIAAAATALLRWAGAPAPSVAIEGAA
jgi:MFS transporter, AAHS family, 4-hydroxybenzoate transporter